MQNQFHRPIPGTGQSITIGAASVQTTAFGPQTQAVRVVTTGNCHVELGMNPTATANSLLFTPQSAYEIFYITPGSKAAVIQDAASTGICNFYEVGG